MKKKEIKYILSPSEKDRIFVSFQILKGKIINFVIQHHSLTKKGWQTIVRYDTCHNIAHKHVYHYSNKKIDRYPMGEKKYYNEIYTQAYKEIIEKYKKIKENYLHT